LIEHLFDPDRFLTEILRVLKPNGVLFLTTPNLASWINRICLLLGFQPHFTEVSLLHNVGKLYGGVAAKASESAIAGHLRLFVPRALDSLLRIYGFDVIARKGAGIGYGSKSLLPFPISAIDRLFASRYSTSAFLIYVGRKRA
jgi:SAM-dependent methyltransferase